MKFSGGSNFAAEEVSPLMMIDLLSFLSKRHCLHTVEDNRHVAILEEIQNSTSFVVKDSTGMLAFVVVDDVGYNVPAAVEAVVDFHAFHLSLLDLLRWIEENAHQRMIYHNDLLFQYSSTTIVTVLLLKALGRLLLQ